MKNIQQNNILTLKQMQEMLPDYIFNKLNAKEIHDFEESLSYYPSIQNELTESQSTFKRIDKADVEKVFIQKSKNISVKIHQRLEKQKNKSSILITQKRLLPALVLTSVVVIFIALFVFQKDLNNDLIDEEYYIMNKSLTDNEVNTIIDLTNKEEEYVEATTNLNTGNYSSLLEDKVVDTIIEEVYNDYLTENLIEYIKNNEIMINPDPKNYQEILKNIDELEKEDFEIIEKELKNAKI